MAGPITLLGLGSFISGIFAGVNGWRSRAQTKALEEKRLASQERLAQINIERQTVFHEENLTFQKQRLYEEKRLQQELATYARQSQLLQAKEQRETALKTVEEQWRLARWPLKLAPIDILGRYPNAQPYPLKVFLAPPELIYDTVSKPTPMSNIFARMENSLSVELQKFLQQYYPVESTLRPVEFIDGAWSSKLYHGRSGIIALHNRLKSEPTMVLELTSTNKTLHLNVGFWSSTSSEPHYRVLAKIPFDRVAQHFATKRIELLKQVQEQLLQQENYDIAKQNRIVEANLKYQEMNARLVNFGIDQLNEYTPDPSDIDSVIHVVVNLLCMVTAWFADAHHLFSTTTPEKVLPLLPKLLSKFSNEPFMGEILLPLLPEFVATYHRLIETLKDEQPYSVPVLAFHLAEGLSQLPDKVWAERWMRYAMVTHLENLGIREIRESRIIETYLQYVDAQNADEIDLLKKCLANLGDHKLAGELALLESRLRKQLLRKDDLLNA